MNEVIIKRAEDILNTKSQTREYTDGMEGIVLSLIDENGYPSASTVTIAKVDGIKTLTFLTTLDANKVKRIRANNKASLCLSSREYNISLVGTAEVLTDLESKKNSWYKGMTDMGYPAEHPESCVIKFTTERYNMFFADNGSVAVGKL